ncbi:HAMP domain-containing histidine kinase [Phenylobacterium sp. 20VBR1]|uniref:histidine kinase n=1 Tax=Phenylobacterium glaciei TaxID=2803784 RepID=A0A941HXG6_9CAUL|nr:HAMP domain-containing sensor histidine kinase [Phenylobacterium glaciei]MBR7620898.1 HAMP domain-containing histidine kinase [Phenylobacterium glaciei]
MAQPAALPDNDDHSSPTAAPRSTARARRQAALDDQQRSFLRMVSHELRTPLNSILGFSEIISQELYGPLGAPQYKEYAGIIQASGQRLLNLVNQILEIARLEGRAMDLDLRVEALDHAMDDALDGLREEIAHRNSVVIVRDEGALPKVKADPRGLRTLLSNLIHNAAVFSPEGSVIEITAARDGAEIEICILDQGPGIDPDDIARLLRPFEQGDSALTRRSEGAGLGLPIVNLLCQAMGGRLKLLPGPRGGLLANVRLPAG